MAGGIGGGSPGARSTFGRGRSASLAAARLLGNRARGAVVKARVVRMRSGSGALRAHVAYLKRDGVTRDGEAGRLFNGQEDEADGRTFAERCADDRHHFRFIVSPDDAAELGSLKDFTRELMAQAERDLGTRLDWLAVDHWNTEHPHVHVLVRGRADDGETLVIGRDYIARGLRARAGALVTQELGPRTDIEIARALGAEVTAERWTRIDRTLAREAALSNGLVDLRPSDVHDPLRAYRIGRMRTLERLGIAAPAGSARWVLAEDAERRLRELGARGDIIKRLHRALGERRGANDWVLEGEHQPVPIVGRLVAHGLDNELTGSVFAIIDGVDGRAHHLKLPSEDALGDPSPNAIVELRRFADAGGQQRAALAVRSDWSIEQQIAADGATWLDRQLVARAPIALAPGGFGEAVRDALERRVAHLSRMGLAETGADSVRFKRGLLAGLERRELDRAGAALARETGLAYDPTVPGEPVGGNYRRRLTLASGRFAMIDNGLGFQLVPWSPSLELRRGQQVDGIAGPGRIDWMRARNRDLSI